MGETKLPPADEIRAQIEKLQEDLADRTIEELLPWRNKHRDLMEEIDAAVFTYGMTGMEFLTMSRNDLRRAIVDHLRSSSGAGRATKGVKIPPRYRHPETGETWTGRGNKPLWVKAWLDKGGSLPQLEIKAP